MLAELTASGRELLEAAAPTHVAGVRKYLISRFSAEGLEGFVESLAGPLQALEEEPGPAQCPTAAERRLR